MKMPQLMLFSVASAVLSVVYTPVVFSDETPGKGKGVAAQLLSSESVKNGEQAIELARDRAKVMHNIYAATLRMLHDRYFHRNKAVLPARAMQDVFDDIERQSSVEARWISASLKPMSIDHRPESDFEKRAAKEIAAGTPQIEVVEEGYYRSAIAIPLTGGCLGCHEGVFQNNGRKKFAGLVISMPLRVDDGNQQERGERQ